MRGQSTDATRLIEFDSLDGLDRRDMATSPTNPKQAPKG